jgi:hypothetical protein
MQSFAQRQEEEDPVWDVTRLTVDAARKKHCCGIKESINVLGKPYVLARIGYVVEDLMNTQVSRRVANKSLVN